MRRCWLVLGLLWLQGCSTIKLGYSQLPHLTYWWLDSAVSFSEPQASATKEALEKLHQWHRREELGPYADWLQRTAQASQAPVDATHVCRQWAHVQEGLERLVRQTIVASTPVVAQLGPRQIQHLAQHLEQKNEDWEKEWLRGPPEQRLQRWLDKIVERYSGFYGDLTSAQIALLREHIQDSAWTPEWGRQERQRRQQDLLATLQKVSQAPTGPAQTQALLLGLWQRWLNPPDAHGQAVIKNLTQQSCQQVAQLHNISTPAQRERAARRLRAYERDLRELIRP